MCHPIQPPYICCSSMIFNLLFYIYRFKLCSEKCNALHKKDRVVKIYAFCLFVFGVNRATREFFTHTETLPLPVKAWKFDLYLALIAIEQ